MYNINKKFEKNEQITIFWFYCTWTHVTLCRKQTKKTKKQKKQKKSKKQETTEIVKLQQKNNQSRPFALGIV